MKCFIYISREEEDDKCFWFWTTKPFDLRILMLKNYDLL